MGPQGPYHGPQRGPLLVKTIFKLKITPRLGLLRSFQLFESAALYSIGIFANHPSDSENEAPEISNDPEIQKISEVPVSSKKQTFIDFQETPARNTLAL